MGGGGAHFQLRGAGSWQPPPVPGTLRSYHNLGGTDSISGFPYNGTAIPETRSSTRMLDPSVLQARIGNRPELFTARLPKASGDA